MNFTAELLQRGYAVIQDNSVFMKPGYTGIAYSDGDATEKRIADVITEAQDISIFSRELAAQCTDWPSLYHLAGTRANILRPFHSTLQQSTVLEIGAGCGAITRYLGECGAQVLALEGSPRRAAIARSRTRDLENVTVVADKFDQFRCDTRFDVITLIGVLEYAPLFTDGEDPVVSMLSRVREMLKPDGQLILAIENQLGLKYFAGFSEDHKGEPMFGIENRYERNDPQTFGRKVLIQKLELAGFTDQQFMVPFPDYKLPISIVTEQGLNCNTFDSTAFAWQTARRDPQVPQHLVFAPELAWPVVAANGLTLDLANSFLVVAHASDEIASPPPILAYHYSTNGRCAAYCKETIFAQQPNGSIILQYNSLGADAARSAEGQWVQFHIPLEAEYIQGETLALQLLRIVTRDNWRIEEVGVFLRQYLAIIKSFLVKEGYLVSYESVASLLPGICFDLVPQNIICSKDGTHQIIDKEWTIKCDIPLGWLLLRILLLLISSLTHFGRTSSSFTETRLGFCIAAIQAARFAVTKEQLDSFAALESKIQAEIHGLVNIPTGAFQWAPEAPLPCYSLHHALADTEQRLTNTEQRLTGTEQRLAIAQSFFLIKEAKHTIDSGLSRTRLTTPYVCFENKGAVAFQPRCFYNMSGKRRKFETVLNRIRHGSRNQLSVLRKLLEKISLFNSTYYLQEDTNLARSGTDPLRHYFFHGAKEGRNPCPYFFTSWYMAEYPDVAASGINPLLHFLLYGVQEGRNPNPYFFIAWYLERNPQIKEQGIHPLLHYMHHGWQAGTWPNPYFDPAWYAKAYLTNNQIGTEPLAHFLSHTAEANLNPNPYFDGKWYLQTYPWVEKMGMHPLQHYITSGIQEKTNPNPYFDSQWYTEHYPESVHDSFCPLAHYLAHTKDNSVNPNPYFDAEWYCNSYPDVKNNGADPFLHYLLYGTRELRDPGPFFSTSWYVKKYPDVKESDMNPLLHFLEFGAFECRDPHPDFDTGWYLTAYPEVLETELPPLLHYIHRGKEEGKLPHDPNRIIQNKATDYVSWHKEFFELTDIDRFTMRAHIEQFEYIPLFSVLMPIYNPHQNFLIEAIESVQAQIYPNWELYIADDTSTDPVIHKILKKYSEDDQRIKVVFREKHGHITGSSNSTLELVSGDYVALLDNDDLLTEDALFWVAASLQQRPDAELIYSDEDRIGIDGKIKYPYFKPDWDPFLFLGQNYFSHLSVYRSSLLKQIGGFRVGYEGSHGYDIAARCIEITSPDKIIHIPRILYHWRIFDRSTATDFNEKFYVQISAEKLINEHLESKKINANIRTNTIYRTTQGIVFHDNDTFPLVSIIIPTRDNVYLTRNCIESILNGTDYKPYEIILVDNGSDEPESLTYFGSLASEGIVRLLRDDTPFNYSRLNNRAVNIANGEVVILLNNDTEVINSEWLNEMTQLALLPGVGAVGAKLFFADYSIQHAGVIIGIGGCASHIYHQAPTNSGGYFSNLHLLRKYSAVTAACLAVRKISYLEVGGLDEDSFVVGFNDVDFCLKLQERGYQNLWTPKAQLFHHESVSRGIDNSPEKQRRFWDEISLLKKRWPNSFYHDPAYNPNLTLHSVDYALSKNPRTVLNALHWPKPFLPSYISPKTSGLRLLVIVDSQHSLQECKFLTIVKSLLHSGEVNSYAIAGPKGFLEVSTHASGWFDILYLLGIPYHNHWFEHNVMRYASYITYIEELSPYLAAPETTVNNLAYQSLVHASRITVDDNAIISQLNELYGLHLEQSAYIIHPNDSTSKVKNVFDHENFINFIKKVKLSKAIPACCLGIS